MSFLGCNELWLCCYLSEMPLPFIIWITNIYEQWHNVQNTVDEDHSVIEPCLYKCVVVIARLVIALQDIYVTLYFIFIYFQCRWYWYRHVGDWLSAHTWSQGGGVPWQHVKTCDWTKNTGLWHRISGGTSRSCGCVIDSVCSQGLGNDKSKDNPIIYRIHYICS